MVAITQKAKAIQLAQKQVKENDLKWENGKGYDLDYKAICQATGLKYGPAWRAVMAELMPKSERRATTDTARNPLPEAVLAARIAAERYAHNYSWGYIHTQFGISASRVYRLFEVATGIMAQGQRIGAGGRYYQKNAALYTGKDRQQKGSELKRGTEAKPTQKRTLGVKVAAAKRKASAAKAK